MQRLNGTVEWIECEQVIRAVEIYPRITMSPA